VLFNIIFLCMLCCILCDGILLCLKYIVYRIKSIVCRVKVIWKANIVEFLIKYFHLCLLILTKINCITLKIRSKADLKNKSQNIWQQIILFSRKWYARDPRFELFREDYRSCALFSWWKRCRMQVKIYSMCTT
jgi:hypothetical protein